MYTYQSKYPKRAEQTLFWLLLFLGLCLFGFSQMYNVPLPMLYRSIGILSISIALAVHARYLRVSYRYSVEPRPDAPSDAPLDFVVTELSHKRIREVMRISVADVTGIIPCTKKNKKTMREAKKGKTRYELTSFLFPPKACLLLFLDGDRQAAARILADEELLKALNNQ
ncbi:MAG: hypothetical protein E7637_09075 [Ruminococcaceae bacterium]|nr:hypothetical protein [Oscillospiraceae bacterium]